MRSLGLLGGEYTPRARASRAPPPQSFAPRADALRSAAVQSTRRHAVRLALIVIVCAAAGCVQRATVKPDPPLSELRKTGPSSADPEVAGYWLLRELVSPGGKADRARAARARLDALGRGGMLAAFARGLDDGLHGRLAAAAEHYLEAVRAAREAEDERAPLIAWFAANRALSLSHDVPDLWKRWKPFVQQAVQNPRNLGWRARSELAEWSIDESWTGSVGEVSRIRPSEASRTSGSRKCLV